MRVYAGMDPGLPLARVGEHARRIEVLGYDGLHVAETVHDSLTVSALALEHTRTLTVRTAVTLAFVRSPTLVAYAAWGLSRLSGGRFQLGLGTQVRQHVEERYGMPWDDPVGRLADYVAAVSDLFRSFSTGERLDHRGPHYELTRLPPYFNPGPDPDVVVPPIWIGGVNPGVCRLAGAVADGFVTHPTNSHPRYLAERCRPHLAEGAASVGRDLGALEVVAGVTVVTGADEDGLAVERERQRRLVAFLYSTPAYRPTLELHGWASLGGDLRRLVRPERWDDLGDVVTDEVLDALVPMATHRDLPALLLDRYGGLADGVLVSAPDDPTHDAGLAEAVATLRAAG